MPPNDPAVKLVHAAAASVLALAVTAAPALAQADFTGQWAPIYQEDPIERVPGPELGDYTGLPLNDAARLRADSWHPDRISVVQEYQCRPHSSDYNLRGLAPLRITADYDPQTQRIVAFHTYMGAYQNERTIHLDGRPHPPPYAAHTFQGFSTGAWNGNMLTIRTTHLKQNYLRRNGVPRSAKAVFTEHWARHGDYLTITSVVEDPAFLTEPLVRSQTWFLDPGQQVGLFPCEYLPEVPAEAGAVPHFLPGENPNLQEYRDWYAVPAEGARGLAETLYPEYRSKLRDWVPKIRCERFCNCTGSFGDCLSPTGP
jgi:hypothetical protein